MNKRVIKTNNELESALSEFITQISNKPINEAEIVAKKFLYQIETKLSFPKKNVDSIFSELNNVEHNQPIYINDIPFISFCEHHMFPFFGHVSICLLYTSPSPRDGLLSRMPSSA